VPPKRNAEPLSDEARAKLFSSKGNNGAFRDGKLFGIYRVVKSSKKNEINVLFSLI
jgi:hypothetical protein